MTEAARNFADCVNRAHYQGTTFLLVKKWRLRTAAMPVVADDPESNDLRERIRKETEV